MGSYLCTHENTTVRFDKPSEAGVIERGMSASKLDFDYGEGRTVNILTIDGGGCRGVFSMEILKEVERQCGGKKLSEVFDLIVGTSAGGLSALALASLDYSGDDCTALYKKLAHVMFNSSTLGKIAMEIKTGGKSMFDDSKFVELAKQTYGDKILNEVDCLTNVAVLSARVDVSPPMGWLAKSYDTEIQQSDYVTDVPVWLAGRCTAAAPFVLGPQHIEMPDHRPDHKGEQFTASFVDGGIWQNNPVYEAIVEAESLFGRKAKMNILSVGTGKYTKKYVDIDEAGLMVNVRNAAASLNLQIGGRVAPVLTADNPKRNFIRLNGYLSEGGDSFDEKYIPGWIEDGQKYVKENKARIAKFCDQLNARMAKED